MRSTLSVLPVAAAMLLLGPAFAAADDEAPVAAAAAVSSAAPQAAPAAAEPATPAETATAAPAAPEVATPAAIEAPAPVAAPAPAVMDLTVAPTSLWQRIRNGFGLPDISSPLVRDQEAWFASRPDYIKRTVERSSRYLFYIVQEVEKRGMPSEIALLPIIESAYNPVAYSRAHASGIWQFIPSTGKLYGLQQNFWYDGRRDVTAATNAALDYLEKLYEQFGSWDLALAAYNWGENGVSRAIAKNLAKGLAIDYQSLSMPLETRCYLPKLQAVKNIIADPAKYGIDLADVPNQPYFVAVTTTRHIDVKLAARFADVPLDEFISLNPGYSRPVIRAASEQTLLLPTDKAELFRANLENYDEPLVSWQTYKLKPGDSIERIAAHHGMSVAQLKHVNGISGKRRVGAGSTLLVPGTATATPHLPDLPAPPVSIVKAKKYKKYAHARKGGTVRTSQSRSIAKKPASSAKVSATRAKPVVLAQKPR